MCETINDGIPRTEFSLRTFIEHFEGVIKLTSFCIDVDETAVTVLVELETVLDREGMELPAGEEHEGMGYGFEDDGEGVGVRGGAGA